MGFYYQKNPKHLHLWSGIPFLSFFLKFLNIPYTISCLSCLPRPMSKVLTSLASKRDTPQKRPNRTAKLYSILILLDLSTMFDVVNHETLELETQHGNGLFLTWGAIMSGDMSGYLLHVDYSLVTYKTYCFLSTRLIAPLLSFYSIPTLWVRSYPQKGFHATSSFLPQTHFIMSHCTCSSPEIKSQQDRVTVYPVVSQDNSMITPSDKAHNHLMVLDNQRSFSPHVANLTQVYSIWPFLSTWVTNVLVETLAILRLDYCNLLLAEVCHGMLSDHSSCSRIFKITRLLLHQWTSLHKI